ncbi:MAG TPA: pyridoxamine 5'-phosphate oxidase family protein [Kribbella sp.]
MNAPHRRFDEAGLEILSEAECHKLLGSVPVGRLVFTQSALPAVRLVNFIVDNMTIVFPASDGDKYRAAERGDVVGFEVDEIDLDRHLGWTVTAVGHLSVVEPNEEADLQHILPLRPWAAQGDHHLIRLGIESLEGRRLDACAQRPYGDTLSDETRC